MDSVHLAVNGTLMRGFELHPNLLAVGAEFLAETLTAPIYRLWSIADRYPAMQRVERDGAAITLEVWVVPRAGIATILLQEPPGLCIGTVRLCHGGEVLGVLGEAIVCLGQRDITRWGGWRAYMNRGTAPETTAAP